MIVDGRTIAEDILVSIEKKVGDMEKKPLLTVFTCDPNFETQKFLNLKRKKAGQVGIELQIIELPESVTTDAVVAKINEVKNDTDGIIVQFPFPEHIDAQVVIHAIPTDKDVDALNPETTEVLSPIAGALVEIIQACDVETKGKKVVVVGAGRLVGKPAAAWFRKNGNDVTVVTHESRNIEKEIAAAEILVLGAGNPGFVKEKHIQAGVVLLDAGTSEEWGELKGDADPACAHKASLFTPVPGGIGPVTVAILLQNLLALAARRTNM